MKDLRTIIENTIDANRLIARGDHIILGLSGGPDSLSLFDVLYELRKPLGFSLYAVHVNHRLRPGAAEEDQAFVEALCKERDIPLKVVAQDCHALAEELHLTDEEAGRKLRYDSFFEACRDIQDRGAKADAIKVAVAHNQNDQLETVLQRLIRGVGTEGLAGMDYRRMDEQGYAVIRPLLDADRETIEAYCQSRNLNPRRDHTNEEPIYLRNKIRLELLPYLEKEFNPNIKESLGRLSRIAKEDAAYLTEATAEAFEKTLTREIEGGIVLDRGKLSNLPDALRHRVYRLAFEKLGLTRDVGYVHVLGADDLLKGARGHGQLDFPHGYTLGVSYEKVYVMAPGQGEEAQSPAKGAGGLAKLTVRIAEDEPYTAKEGEAIFDLDALEEALPTGLSVYKDLTLRSRREGDFLALKNGHKKIQDLLVDEKVPSGDRPKVLLAAIGSEVLWIPPGILPPRYSANYPKTEASRRLLILALDREL